MREGEGEGEAGAEARFDASGVAAPRGRFRFFRGGWFLPTASAEAVGETEAEEGEQLLEGVRLRLWLRLRPLLRLLR